METMENNKVGIRDIFKAFTEFFKQQVEEERENIEKQVMEIQSAEEKGYIEKLQKDLETHEIEGKKRRKSVKTISKNQVIRTKETQENQIQDIELEK